MERDLLDIVIVTYKSKDYLDACLGSIRRDLHTMRAKIFVEDNNSGEDLRQLCERFQPIELSLNTRNLGFARAANKGISRGTAPYIVLINPDSLIMEGFFQKVFSFMETNPDIGVLGPRIMNVDGTIQGSARAFPGPLTAVFGRSSFLSRLFPGNRITRKNVLSMLSDGASPMSVDWVSGACMVIRRKAFHQVGMFDEQFFMYWEDADLCRRMRQKGWKVVYYPLAGVVHHLGASSSRRVFKSLLNFHNSSYRLFSKYLQKNALVLKPLAIAALAARLAIVLPPTVLRCKLQRSAQAWRQRGGGSHTDLVDRKGTGKIRVLRVISRLNIGGPSIHVSFLAKALNPREFENYLVIGTPSGREGYMGYLLRDNSTNIIKLSTLRREIDLKADFKTIISLLRLMVRIRPHIVDTHTAKAGFTARTAALLYRVFFRKQVYLIHTFHGNVFYGYFDKKRTLFYIWIERLLGTFTDTVVAISPSQKMELTQKYKIASQEKVRVLKVGMDLQPFFSLDRKCGRFRRQLGIRDDLFLVGIVGRLVPIKNHVMFLKAGSLLIRRWPHLGIKFLIVGDGELRERLQRTVTGMGMEEHVMFCGWIKDIAPLYADLDVLVLTSLNEGTPVSLIEAMASRVPVVSTCVGGVPDLLGNPVGEIGEGGFEICERGILCSSNDEVGLARAVKYLMEEPAEQRDKRLGAALSFVRSQYSIHRLLADVESLYRHASRGIRGRGGHQLLAK